MQSQVSPVATPRKGRVDERPFVAVRNHTYPCIALWRARKFIYVVEYDRGIRVNKINVELFDREYDQLHPYVAGRVDQTQEYDVQKAARKYLDWGSYAGITEVAETALQTIINRKGTADMSNIESAAATQGDAKTPPPAATLGAALAKVKTPAAKPTKNGTTAEAKKPGKTKVVKPAAKKAEPAKKDAKAKPAAKKDAKAKPAAKKAEPAKKPLTTKAAKPKAEGRGRPSSLDGDLKIKVLVEGNPRREGGQGYENWPVIKRYDGKTVEAYLKAGGRSDNLRTDIDRGHVKLVK